MIEADHEFVDHATISTRPCSFFSAHYMMHLPRCLCFNKSSMQITLAIRYGTVTRYDDTAVKKRYRAPLGMFVVIDDEYNSRLVAQSVTEDTTTYTFVWMLEAYREAMGKAPEVFIQDADQALTEAVLQVYPYAVLKRCVWHLNQSLDKNLGPIVRYGMKVRETMGRE